MIGTDGGPAGLFVTASEGEHLDGVTCVATREGGYEVSLRLVCGLVPLLALGDRVRAAIASMSTLAGLPVQNVSVSVHVVAIAEGAELVAIAEGGER